MMNKTQQSDTKSTTSIFTTYLNKQIIKKNVKRKTRQTSHLLPLDQQPAGYTRQCLITKHNKLSVHLNYLESLVIITCFPPIFLFAASSIPPSSATLRPRDQVPPGGLSVVLLYKNSFQLISSRFSPSPPGGTW